MERQWRTLKREVTLTCKPLLELLPTVPRTTLFSIICQILQSPTQKSLPPWCHLLELKGVPRFLVSLKNLTLPVMAWCLVIFVYFLNYHQVFVFIQNTLFYFHSISYAKCLVVCKLKSMYPFYQLKDQIKMIILFLMFSFLSMKNTCVLLFIITIPYFLIMYVNVHIYTRVHTHNIHLYKRLPYTCNRYHS